MTRAEKIERAARAVLSTHGERPGDWRDLDAALALPPDEPAAGPPPVSALSREQALRVAREVRGRCDRYAYTNRGVSDADLDAIVSRVLGEPSEVERAERAVVDAALAVAETREALATPSTDSFRDRQEAHANARTRYETALAALRAARAKVTP